MRCEERSLEHVELEKAHAEALSLINQLREENLRLRFFLDSGYSASRLLLGDKAIRLIGEHNLVAPPEWRIDW